MIDKDTDPRLVGAHTVISAKRPEANVYQYLASKRERTDAERAALRDYLNAKYPDAPG